MSLFCGVPQQVSKFLCLPDLVNRGYTITPAHFELVYSIGVGIRRMPEKGQASCVYMTVLIS
jgi:hypothetical protein